MDELIEGVAKNTRFSPHVIAEWLDAAGYKLLPATPGQVTPRMVRRGDSSPVPLAQIMLKAIEAKVVEAMEERAEGKAKGAGK